MATYILVGARSDIAQATLRILLKNPEHTVIQITRDVENLPDSQHEKCHHYSCDATDHQKLNSLFEQITSEHTVDAVINFCGSIMLKPVGLLTENDWNNTININLNTAFNVSHAACKYIKHDFSLVLFSTAAAHLGLPNHEAIAAAKAGVEGLSKSIAASYANKNIRSNVIAPGLIESKLSAPILKSEKSRQVSQSLHTLSRLGTPEDIAKMVYWLTDPENNWITGEVIRIDGGLSTTKNYVENHTN